MNVFGKNKIPSQVPPVPPRRPETTQPVVHASNAEEEEEEEDDQYTYEVPPSEEQSKTVAAPRRQEAAESLYLDRQTLRRFSEPNSRLQPKPSMFLSKHGALHGHEEEMFSCQAIERALQTGPIKMPVLPPFPLSVRRVSLPILAPTGSQAKAATSRDLFQAPTDDKEESEEEESIYVECEPSTTSESCRGLACSVPTLPARPLKQPKPKLFSPGPQQVLAANSSEGGCLKSGSLLEDSGLQNNAWYAGSCDRPTAEAALLQFNKDGAYMVRQSSRRSCNQPFTLVVLYKNHVYNIPIRYMEDSCQYTPGKAGKDHEELFDSVSSIIQNYAQRPLVLIDGHTAAKEQTCLLFPVKP